MAVVRGWFLPTDFLLLLIYPFSTRLHFRLYFLLAHRDGYNADII